MRREHAAGTAGGRKTSKENPARAENRQGRRKSKQTTTERSQQAHRGRAAYDMPGPSAGVQARSESMEGRAARGARH